MKSQNVSMLKSTRIIYCLKKKLKIDTTRDEIKWRETETIFAWFTHFSKRKSWSEKLQKWYLTVNSSSKIEYNLVMNLKFRDWWWKLKQTWLRRLKAVWIFSIPFGTMIHLLRKKSRVSLPIRVKGRLWYGASNADQASTAWSMTIGWLVRFNGSVLKPICWIFHTVVLQYYLCNARDIENKIKKSHKNDVILMNWL